MEQRIIQLESLIAMQDNTVNQLSTEIFRQQQEIGRLTQRISLLEEKIRELGESDPIAGNERPPHW